MSRSTDGRFEGFDAHTYGARFADVYDHWYADITDVDATVALLLDLAGNGPVLELGVGTGRIAVPLAAAGRKHGIAVTGVDVSPDMLAVLRSRDADGLVDAIEADMVDELPATEFSLVAVLYNTLFSLTADGAHAALFAAVADRLSAGGRFVVETFVPDADIETGSSVELRSMRADQVVLSVSRSDAKSQRIDGQFVEFTETGGVRLRPWSIRFLTVEQLDRLAEAAGFTLEHRWADVDRSSFTASSERHVSVYRRG